jgi:hypothetical protein
MTKYGVRLTCLMTALALGALPPQFAQEASKDRAIYDQQSPLHSLMAGFVRTVNTAEVTYHAQGGSYGSWQDLLANQQQYLNGWLAQFYPQFYPQAANIHFGRLPEVLPGLNLRLNVAPDGRSYVVLVEDAADKTGFAFVSDERGVIRYCKFIR